MAPLTIGSTSTLREGVDWIRGKGLLCPYGGGEVLNNYIILF